MANAKPADVRAGWTIYRNDPRITLEVLNDRLARNGYGPISQRTFGHYRHLVEHGYDRYISINRFDVARGSRPYEGAGGSARYRFYDTELPVTVVLTRPQGVFQAPGVAEKVGEVGALITFAGDDVIEGQRVLHSLVRRELKNVSATDPTPRFLALQDELWESLFSLQRQDVRELEVGNDAPGEQSADSAE